MATFLGLHTYQPSGAIPEDSVSVQVKRRIFCSIFNTDMIISTLTGRPPLLRGGLCSTPLPLDIDDASLMNAKIKNYRLDKDGWNTEGKNHPMTFLRAAYTLGRIRSEILEMVLQVPNHASNYDFE